MQIYGLVLDNSIGSAMAAGGGLPATFVTALASGSLTPTRLGCIDVVGRASIAPAQAGAAWGRASHSASPRPT
jgi:hypothetical protein